MGSGVSKKKGGKATNEVVVVVGAKGSKRQEEPQLTSSGAAGGASASSASGSAPPPGAGAPLPGDDDDLGGGAPPVGQKDPLPGSRPEKPKASQEVKRPSRVAKGSGNGGSGTGGRKKDEEPTTGKDEDGRCSSPSPKATEESPDFLPSQADDVEEAEARNIAKAEARNSGEASSAAKAEADSPATEASPGQASASSARELAAEELPLACRQGDEAAVKAFLLRVQAQGAGGLTEVEEALFDTYGDSALHHAAHGGHLEVAQMLVGSLGKVEVDIPNARNETSLQVACRRGDGNMAALLLKAGADPDRRDGSGLTPFLSAVFGGASEDLLSLIHKAGGDISSQDTRGVGAMHFAALRGDIQLMSWLATHSADVDVQTEHGTTALMLASKRGLMDGVSLLLAAKANTNLSDEAGCTALMQALSAGNTEVALKLLEGGASVDTVDSAGRSALFHAVLGDEAAPLEAVIKRAGRVNMLDEEGRSPLYQACLMGVKDLAKLLLDAGADPNLAGRGSTVRPAAAPQREDGGEEDGQDSYAARACLDEARTCLQVCATLAHNELLVCLLEYGADINAAPGGLGWTSLHLCAVVNNEEGAALLLARGSTTSLEDAEGNTALSLAERAGHAPLLEKLKEAAEAEPRNEGVGASPTAARNRKEGESMKSPVRRRQVGLASLPPLFSGSEAEAAETAAEDQEPLEAYRSEWESRDSDGSLLDRVFTPMVHDAMRGEQWRDRWEAMSYVSKHFAEASGWPADLVLAAVEVISLAAKDKMPKVFTASLTIWEELLGDARVDDLGAEEFSVLLRSPDKEQSFVSQLLDQTDAGGGSANAASPQQAAADALCSCILHGRVPIDEVAYPLMARIDERLLADQGKSKDRKEKLIGPKCLGANLKLLGRMLTAFGLQQSGLFRRALVLPLLLRAAASEHSKVRAASGDCLVQMMALSGGLEERIWALLPSKATKSVQALAGGQEGISLLSAVPCEEDALVKGDILAEDSRAGRFVCVAELNAKVWKNLQSGERAVSVSEKKTKTPSGPEAERQSSLAESRGGAPGELSLGERSDADDECEAKALTQAFASKNWKARAESIAKLSSELASGDGVKEASGEDGGPLLSQYVLSGLRVSTLQEQLSGLLADTVTAVFVAASDLLSLICAQLPLYIAPLFLEPLLPPLVARLLDTSNKVRSKAVETTMEVAELHGCALSEMLAQCVASGSAWCSNQPPPTPGGSLERNGESDRSTRPRLQLLVKLVGRLHDRDSVARWSDETWKSLCEYSTKAAENKNGDVRKEAAALLQAMLAAGGRAEQIAEHACNQLKELAEAKAKQKLRPGTSMRPMTGARLGTAGGAGGAASRPGTGAKTDSGLSMNGTGKLSLNGTGKLSNLGGTLGSTGGFTLNLNSTGRLSTANRSRAGNTGSSFRPPTGLRPGTGLRRDREMDEESDNSVHSDAPAAEAEAGEEGVMFFDVKHASRNGGADEVPDLAEGEAALKEALPLAEALDEVAMDFVAPLIALFGDGWTRCFYSRNWVCRVAALTHLSASMTHRLAEITSTGTGAGGGGGELASPTALGELLDGAMRAVHEGLGDQNVRVYAEACMSVTAVVPAFCGAVDGRLLVAHLAPLLRQLCARMGDSKEVLRTQTTQAIFRLLNPPVGNIVSPVAIAMLILRHLMPSKENEASPETPGSCPKASAKGAATGWLCRLGALRDLAKEHSKSMVLQPGSTSPGEWLRLQDGLKHPDPTVRHESARLYTLVCKMHLKSLGSEEVQTPAREAWVAALPKDVPAKSLAQARKLLKLTEETPGNEETAGASSGSSGARAQKLGMTSSALPWQVPANLAVWAGCAPEVLAVLSAPSKGDEKAAIAALKALGKGVGQGDKAAQRGGAGNDEAFGGLCRAVQQCMAFPTGGDRYVFLCSVELLQMAVTQMSSSLSGLDLNLGLGKTFPTLLERTALAGASGDVKVGVASDKLVQMLAKHPKVGCEAVTKMVISAVLRSDAPVRPLVLLRTLLSDFGLRLCAQRDVVSLLLNAAGTQLERISNEKANGIEGNESVRPQLIGALATCNQFSPETVHFCMSEVDAAQRKLIFAALAEAPNPRLVALGATAAEQQAGLGGSSEATPAVGSAARAASRSRGASPKPSPADSPHASPVPSPESVRSERGDSFGMPPGSSPGERKEGLPGACASPGLPRPGPLPAVISRHNSRGSLRPPLAEESLARSGSGNKLFADSSPSGREASPGSNSRRRRRMDCSPQNLHDKMNGQAGGVISEASTAASTEFTATDSPFAGISRTSAGSTSGSLQNVDGSARASPWSSGAGRPPAPISLSTALNKEGVSWKFKGEGEEEGAAARARQMQRVGSSEGRFMKSKEKTQNDSLASVVDVLGQMEGGKTR